MDARTHMVPFISRFPDSGRYETCVINIRPGSPVLPAGSFAYIEFFCDDPGCDCRRVFLEVRSNDDRFEGHGTIVWGWEKSDYYEQWTGDEYAAALHVAGYLDLDSAQGEHADDFLAVFRTWINDETESLSERLSRHYEMFKSPGLCAPGPAPLAPCIKAGRGNYPEDYLDAWLRND